MTYVITRPCIEVKTPSPEPMDTSNQICPNVTCSARGKTGEGATAIHDKQRRRY